MLPTVLTGVFILASTTSRSSNALLGWNCAYSFVSNIMYGVLYALSPEVFPTKDRGTGNALVATANRIFGIMVMTSILCSDENDLTSSPPGSHYCALRQSYDVSADIYCRCAFLGCRVYCTSTSFRATGKSVAMISVSLELIAFFLCLLI
jgi:uncharacterized membrane protein